MKRLGERSLDQYTTGFLLGSSEDRGWSCLHAERWRNSAGDLGEVEIRHTKIVVLVDGSLSIRQRRNGRLEKLDAVPGMTWICPSGSCEDMFKLYGEVRESIHLFFPASPLSRTALAELGADPDKIELRYKGGFHDPLIEQITWAIRAELLEPSPVGKMLVENLASALDVHLLRQHSNLNPASVSLPAARGALDSRRLSRVKDFIESHLGEDLSIVTLANEACLSPFHFARAFKAATGTSPHSYLTDRRIKKAKSLIAEGRIPLAEIAHLCGFSTQAYFTTWFKRVTHTTPGAYRASLG